MQAKWRVYEALTTGTGWRCWACTHFKDQSEYQSLHQTEERRRHVESVRLLYNLKNYKRTGTNMGEPNEHIITYTHVRRGLLWNNNTLPSNNRARIAIQTTNENSFSVFGPRLFNCVPKEIRKFQGPMLSMKRKLVNFHSRIPDKTSLPHYCQRVVGNSIVN